MENHSGKLFGKLCRYQLTDMEVQAIAYISSVLKESKDGYQLEYRILINKMAEACSIAADKDRTYEQIKSLMKDLLQMPFYLNVRNGETSAGFINKVTFDKQKESMILIMDSDIVPYLYHIKKEDIILSSNLRSSYTGILYNLLKKDKKREYTPEALKEIMNVSNVKSYTNFNLFRTRVLDTAITDINNTMDIHVDMEQIREGKRIAKVVFAVEQKGREIRNT